MAGQNHFLPGPSDAFFSYFNANEEYKRRFYSNSYDSCPGSGYWQQFEEMAKARQSSSIASGASNNTNASRAKVLFQLWAGTHELLYSGESRTYNVDKNLRRETLGWLIVTYISISNVLVPACWPNATTVKIWNLRNFCQLFSSPKIGNILNKQNWL